jgi:hypothetical protein
MLGATSAKTDSALGAMATIIEQSAVLHETCVNELALVFKQTDRRQKSV